MHRSAIALAAAGVVAATVLVTTDVTGPDDGPSDDVSAPPSTSSPSSSATSKPPATSPSRTALPNSRFTPVTGREWMTAVPDDVPLAAGLADDGGDYERVSEPVTWSFCDTEAFPVGTAADARREGATGPEYADRRDLRVFPDDRAAHAFLRQATSVSEGCPEEQHGATRWIHTVSPATPGEESVRIIQTYETDGLPNAGATWWDVVRVGNAVLVTATGGEYVPGETLGQGIRDYQRLIAPIVSAMCVFSANGCPDEEQVVTGDHAVPDDFPLAAGFPPEGYAEPGRRYGRTGPGRGLPLPSWKQCGESVAPTGFEDRLAARWANVEDYRGRELFTFADAAAAEQFAGSLVALWEDCPRSEPDHGYVSVQDVRPLTVGGQSWALLSWSEYRGDPAIGLTVVEVVRVGHAVLVDQVSNEAGGPGEDGDRSTQVDRQLQASGDVIAAMCVFTEAGC